MNKTSKFILAFVWCRCVMLIYAFGWKVRTLHRPGNHVHGGATGIDSMTVWRAPFQTTHQSVFTHKNYYKLEFSVVAPLLRFTYSHDIGQTHICLLRHPSCSNDQRQRSGFSLPRRLCRLTCKPLHVHAIHRCVFQEPDYSSFLLWIWFNFMAIALCWLRIWSVHCFYFIRTRNTSPILTL